MASWLRLWHDMPNDPKWRTIARISSQPIALVQATYLHLLVTASRNVTRGHVDVTNEDLASALDVTEDAIASIIDAMQGRVIEGSMLSGWEKRQPAREDAIGIENGAKTAAERKRTQRERERAVAVDGEGYAMSRNVTQCHAPETETETETETEPPQPPSVVAPLAEAAKSSSSAPDSPLAKPARAERLPPALGVSDLVAEGVEKQHAEDWLKVRREKRAPLTRTAWDQVTAEAGKAGITVAEAVRIAATNSWQGFKASWLAKAAAPSRQNGRPSPHILPPAGVGAYGEGHVPKDYKFIPEDPNDPDF